VRYFNGSVGSGAAVLDVSSTYNTARSCGASPMLATSPVVVNVLDAYTADFVEQVLQPGESFENELSLKQFYGWYDLVVTVAEESTFNYRLAGHVETGKDSFSDPAPGGLVNLKG
jgi:phospholipase C